MNLIRLSDALIIDVDAITSIARKRGYSGYNELRIGVGPELVQLFNKSAKEALKKLKEFVPSYAIGDWEIDDDGQS